MSAATAPKDMGLLGLGLQPLKGHRKGVWSVKVSDNWRWTPRGEEGDIPHLISARKAEIHEEKNWARHYQKRG